LRLSRTKPLFLQCFLRVIVCVIFAPNSGYIARYAPFIWHKSPTNCDAHLTESIFQTRSSPSQKAHWQEHFMRVLS